MGGGGCGSVPALLPMGLDATLLVGAAVAERGDGPCPPSGPDACPRSVWRGYVCLALLIFAFVGQSEMAQYIQIQQQYNKPFFITWLNHGTMAFVLPIPMIHSHITRGRVISLRRRLEAVSKLSLHLILLACSGLSLLYTLGDYVWYLALDMTSVAEATALFNSQSVFAYAFSVCLLGERVRASKLVAVGVSLCGLALIGMYGGEAAPTLASARHELRTALEPNVGDVNHPIDSQKHSSLGLRVLGDTLVAGAAASYALYEVAYARALGSAHLRYGADLVAVNTLTGLIGVCSSLVTAPGLVFLDVAQVEPFELPARATLVRLLVANAALALIFNACLMLSVVMLSPLTTTLGCTLTMPLALFVDWIWHGSKPHWGDLAGAAGLIAGFVLLVVADTYTRHAMEVPLHQVAMALASDTMDAPPTIPHSEFVSHSTPLHADEAELNASEQGRRRASYSDDMQVVSHHERHPAH